jgi:hypothetical protein
MEKLPSFCSWTKRSVDPDVHGDFFMNQGELGGGKKGRKHKKNLEVGNIVVKVRSLPVLGLFFDLSLPDDSQLMEGSCLNCFLLGTSPWRLERRRGRKPRREGEQKPVREGDGRIWGGDARIEEGGERRKKRQLFGRSGRGPGDHMHFF